MSTTQSKSTTKRAYLFYFLIFLTSVTFLNRYTGGDSRASLFVSDAIITNGSIHLEYLDASSLDEIKHATVEINEHLYDYFPIGVPVLSLPFVYISKAFGLNMLDHGKTIERTIALMFNLLSFTLLINIARKFLSLKDALNYSALFWFSTSLVSTLESALWSHVPGVFFCLLTIWATLSIPTKKHMWLVIGISLFFAYLCRPTYSLFGLFLGLYFVCSDFKNGFKSGLVFICCVSIFMYWSYTEYGHFLPPYYEGSRLEPDLYFTALAGNLVSPSRGIFTFSPFLIMIGIIFLLNKKNGLYQNSKPFLSKAWWWIMLAWPIAHLNIISLFPKWWGGYCYGSRLMVDVLPAIFLLGIYMWPPRIGLKASNGVSGKLLVLSFIISISIHSIQGVYNRYVLKWSSFPSVDQHPDQMLFDWKYPQFLANPIGSDDRFERMELENTLNFKPTPLEYNR